MTINQKLRKLRLLMKDYNIDAYLIPSSDPHQSEYFADHWKVREWISGFDGSAGLVVVTQDHAGLWTDSRYFLQAETQLADSEMVLHKVNNQFGSTHIKWILDNLSPGQTLGLDGWLFSKSQVENLTKKMEDAALKVNPNINLINPIWEERPGLPMSKVFEHDVLYAGKSSSEKIETLRIEMRKQKTVLHLIPTLDDIAWVFNLRGHDVAYNPVAIAYAVIGLEESLLFIDEEKIDKNIKANLAGQGVRIRPYMDIVTYLNEIDENAPILVDKTTCSNTLYRAINSKNILHGSMIPRDLKAIKNNIEIRHIKHAMVKDGVALTKLFMWLEETVENRKVAEVEVAEKLSSFRAQQEYYYGESFAAIVGYAANGAIIHYRPEANTCAYIVKENILLLDSGGQYQDGTTDITRTVAMGMPSDEQRKRFTLVLKGHIALDQAYYPEGTTGSQVDMLARQFLWKNGLNFQHGTGHGVGFFLNVHEPPQGFTAGSSSRGDAELKSGMVTSNEPGYYKDGVYGIRIENLILTVKSEHEGFLKHENLTLFPMDHQLIDVDLLTPDEIMWLNQYHDTVYKKLSPHLNHEEQIWLGQKCKHL